MAKCAECGLLSARRRSTSELCEVDEFFRAKGHPAGMDEDRLDIREIAFCALDKRQFPPYAYDEFVAQSNIEMPCESFTPWRRGFTPKEHQEMIDRERREKDEREQKLTEAERERRWRREDNIFRIVQVVLTIVGLLSGVWIGKNAATPNQPASASVAASPSQSTPTGAKPVVAP